MGKRRPYRRAMDGWWTRNPFFVRYMIREWTAVLVAAYALVLLVGAVRLAQGEAAYSAWFESMKSPFALAFHWVTLAVFLYHTWSWFEIMPRTMPAIFVGGKRLARGVITAAGIAAALACCAIVLALALGGGR
ncbi:MAG: fumarate reductase subunit C [Burkholderiales bacterium]|nr:fumarate reductase subunit C [Burkholderiales bacterium]